ncbi:hypothetical protein D623_10029690 [Myotis brandtii]|uniref:Uncharacterized protein n=1 Tax=Myotis brandtii TaxID=109478 RepID=S7N852_MYOBR|nr:hypothetical protein D623_10029690 [Myotis brandtii]
MEVGGAGGIIFLSVKSPGPWIHWHSLPHSCQGPQELGALSALSQERAASGRNGAQGDSAGAQGGSAVLGDASPVLVHLPGDDPADCVGQGLASPTTPVPHG